MSKLKTWHAIAVIVIFIAFLTGGYYNSFIRLDQNIAGKWAQVENEYQRRIDVVPNLVNTVKGFAKQEQEIFDKITQAREAFAAAATPAAQVKAANDLEGFLTRLFAIAESNPEIKSNANFLALQSQLEGTENRVAVERRRYNEAVQTYNTRVKIFPGNLFARWFGFSQKEFFQATAGSENAPTVTF